MSSSMVKILWAYRGFVLGSVKREFQAKYRNSLLGAAWNVLNPLSMIVVYTVIFSQVMKAKLPGVDSSFAYSIYLCAGILTWGLFSEIVTRGQSVFLDNANLLKKISFPRLCLPVTIVCNALLNFIIVFGLFTLFLIVSGNFPGIVYIGLMPVLSILIIFSIGLGITVGILNVFFRDVGHFFGMIMQFWFWLTPIVYSGEILPDNIRHYLIFNPLAGIVKSCQTILVKGEWPDWSSLLPAAILGCILCLFGMHLFRKHSGEMVDEL
ncbi:lipopolysaccharide transport system permease [Yersinia intermedia]|jgi:lipopolysaccharide transport system permease protein|uniref:ABC transporter permease n=1 Tax=Yersinia intermedia TaxID=631 RepID=UPI0005AC7DE1|nr:ABC-2 type transporter family protein [Yersinia intermedia]CNH28205.1 lipopolysaccharide transport system permease [Yersinia intermedia]CNH66464.1 lipopolysaccharide transport system permease [Yersinia intermedia]CQD75212.1 lipopolysaccharide transport system permease [Yersinia intermedia]